MSSPPLRVFLTPTEDLTLFELKKASNIAKRTRDRALRLRLSSQGWKVEKIAVFLKCSPVTVRKTIHRWNKKGLLGLWDKPCPGRNLTWQPEAFEEIEDLLNNEQRTYSSSKIQQKLLIQKQISLSKRQIRRILKKKEFLWKRTRQSNKSKQNKELKTIKEADLDMLELAEAVGEICLKYLDESGFVLWSPVSYTWAKKEIQKKMEQKKRGKRISICGLLELSKSFDYGLALGGFKKHSYIEIINWEAEKAYQRLLETGQITVIVQDNGPSHTAKLSLEKHKEWEKKGLYIFFLPKYCSEMNESENSWLRLKTDEIAGEMFEDEYDLAMAVIEAVEDRAAKKAYVTNRYRFPSKLS